MSKEHVYNLAVEWTGNTGSGTSGYRDYLRNFDVLAENKPPIPGSADPSFRGDKERYNPEEMLVASLSSCHMLWFLHLCADAGVIVLNYTDNATGIMVETNDGGGRFKEVVLRPKVTVQSEAHLALLDELHHTANRKCFVANSVNFAVRHEATAVVIR